MQPVTSDQGEKSGQKRAARRTVAAADEIGEFAELDAQECEAQHAGYRHRGIEPEPITDVSSDAGEPACETRQQQEDGLECHAFLVEDLRSLRAVRSLIEQHRVACEEA